LVGGGGGGGGQSTVDCRSNKNINLKMSTGGKFANYKHYFENVEKPATLT
jgi:hypothetical protein